jgi:hypothetical protein
MSARPYGGGDNMQRKYKRIRIHGRFQCSFSRPARQGAYLIFNTITQHRTTQPRRWRKWKLGYGAAVGLNPYLRESLEAYLRSR